MNPVLKTVNQDGSAILVNTESVTLTAEAVNKYVSNLQEQIKQVQADRDAKIASLQEKMDFYLSVQTQQTAVLTKASASLVEEQASFK